MKFEDTYFVFLFKSITSQVFEVRVNSDCLNSD